MCVGDALELPHAAIVLTIVNVAVYIAGASYSLALPMPLQDARGWRAFTCMFAHASRTHIASNMLAQILLFPLLEWDAGTTAATYIYLTSGFCGSLAKAITYGRGDDTILLGASGAIFGLIGAHVGTIVLNFDAPWRSVLLLIVSVGYVSYEIYNAVVDVDSHIAHDAHLFGALAGLVNGLFLTVNVVGKQWESYVRWIGALASILLLVVLLVLFSDPV